MDDVYYVDDFYFDINGNLIRRYMAQVDAERYVEELMVSHNQYHRAVENTNYVTVGSIIGCTYGSILAKLTADEVTEVYVGNGAPVMTCADCATGINIPTFGTCLNPEATQKGLPGTKFGTWGSANGMSGGTYTPEGYKCIPLLDKTWKQPDGKDLIWRDATGTYSYALKDIAVLVCRYGGTIGVVEVNTGAKGSDKEYVTKAQLLSMNWSGTSDSMVKELNRVLAYYEITTTERIRHFLAQCMQETNKGLWIREGEYFLSPPHNYSQQDYETYFNNERYTYKYRGSGYIQLTWEYGYQAFATFLLREKYPELGIVWRSPNNTGTGFLERYEAAVNAAENNGYNVDKYKKIVTEGADYVALEFAWEAAGYDWHAKGLNKIVDELDPNASIDDRVDKVTEVVNYWTSSYQERRDYYKNDTSKVIN